jgi:hypothetical protein
LKPPLARAARPCTPGVAPATRRAPDSATAPSFRQGRYRRRLRAEHAECCGLRSARHSKRHSLRQGCFAPREGPECETFGTTLTRVPSSQLRADRSAVGGPSKRSAFEGSGTPALSNPFRQRSAAPAKKPQRRDGHTLSAGARRREHAAATRAQDAAGPADRGPSLGPPLLTSSRSKSSSQMRRRLIDCGGNPPRRARNRSSYGEDRKRTLTWPMAPRDEGCPGNSAFRGLLASFEL